ncbi:DUF2461 domain-containing protein [Geobacter sp. SVR]|uniref:DUF2461 domain-containing protein n=1 Tax=Geobacter sp. SVR TaxID=2495594 RepID=UPI00143EFCA5|nr:DUF2461 domain-containing protein [Geobacter sp. SVR]BCS51709.1 hypothetical protein GSVR_00170 [Geobacter sp. SVR]GCF84896.1 TIGR02453 family protein [Geobacter sp. SVR]
MSTTFTGFSPHSLAFFEELAANNAKPWFEAHRDEYEEFLLEPLKALVNDLAGPMLAIDPGLITIPAVDRTISRIYRDTRFSRNKSPYKTCLWITFKRPSPDWKTAPCFFFEIRAEGYRYGMGFYSATRETMDTLRHFIETEPDRFREEVGWLGGQELFTVAGECYKRPLNATLPDDLQEWHRRKNLFLVCNRQPDGRLFTRGIVEDLQTGFERLAPLYHLLWRLRG